MKLENILVLGAGESGTWAAILAKREGIQPVLIDGGMIQDSRKALLEQAGVPFLEQQTQMPVLKNVDLVVCSPGMADAHPWMQLILNSDVQLVSELEFASWFNRKKVIAITGSNGKTTTSKLCYHLLHSNGIRASLGGNYGECFSHLLCKEQESDVYVLEVSSFQLDHVLHFKPDISIILNVTPDHLDRYEYQFEKYKAAKFRIAARQSEDGLFILNSNLLSSPSGAISSARLISVSEPKEISDEIVLTHGDRIKLPSDRLFGRHNAFNAHCALEAAYLWVPDAALLENALQSFEGDPHRLELVDVQDGVRFINDSKATNVDAVYYALDAMREPVIWIVGGQDKGNDYSALDELVRKKVKAIVCLGADNKKIIEHFKFLSIPIESCHAVEDALDSVLKYTKSGDCVLLSPACASFDLFANYIDRGNQFKNGILRRRKS